MQDSKSTLQPLPPLSTVTTSTGDLSRGEGTLRLLTVVKPLAVAGCHSQGRKVLKIGDIPPPRLQTRTLKLNEPSITTTTPSCFCFSATIVILCPMLFSRRKEKPTFSFSFFHPYSSFCLGMCGRCSQENRRLAGRDSRLRGKENRENTHPPSRCVVDARWRGRRDSCERRWRREHLGS